LPTRQRHPKRWTAIQATEAYFVRENVLPTGETRLIEMRPNRWRPGQDVAGVVLRAAADGSM
jgi:hypothetical protein